MRAHEVSCCLMIENWKMKVRKSSWWRTKRTKRNQGILYQAGQLIERSWHPLTSPDIFLLQFSHLTCFSLFLSTALNSLRRVGTDFTWFHLLTPINPYLYYCSSTYLCTCPHTDSVLMGLDLSRLSPISTGSWPFTSQTSGTLGVWNCNPDLPRHQPFRCNEDYRPYSSLT